MANSPLGAANTAALKELLKKKKKKTAVDPSINTLKAYKPVTDKLNAFYSAVNRNENQKAKGKYRKTGGAQ